MTNEIFKSGITLEWPEFNEWYLNKDANRSIQDRLVRFQWQSIPLLEKTNDAEQIFCKKTPRKLLLDQGMEVRIDSFEQEDRFVGRYCGTDEHPQKVVFPMLQEYAVGALRNAKGVLLKPPSKLYLNEFRIRHQEGRPPTIVRKGDLPAIKTVISLTGPAVNDANFSYLRLISFEDSFGISEELVSYIKDLDWLRWSVGGDY